MMRILLVVCYALPEIETSKLLTEPHCTAHPIPDLYETLSLISYVDSRRNRVLPRNMGTRGNHYANYRQVQIDASHCPPGLPGQLV